MAGCPRKFSEKIALLNQKAAEGNANYYSIISQVKQIKPSGSQTDTLLNESLNESQKSNSYSFKIDETLSSNEHISTTYTSDQHRQQVLNHFQNANSDTVQTSNKKPQPEKNQFHQAHNSIISNSSFLQLPGQTDSFRRAHSDSSIPQSITTYNNPTTNLDCGMDLMQNIQPYSTEPIYNNQQFQQYQPHNTMYNADYRNLFNSYTNSDNTPHHNTQFSYSDEYANTSSHLLSNEDSINNSNSHIDNANTILSDNSNKSGSNSNDNSTNNLCELGKRKSITSLGAPSSPTHQFSPQSLGLSLVDNHNSTNLGHVPPSQKNQQRFITDTFKNEPLSPNGGMNNFSPNFNQQIQSQSQLSSPGLPSPSNPQPFSYNNQMSFPQQQQPVSTQQYSNAFFHPHQHLPTQQQQHQPQQHHNQPQHQQPRQDQALLSPNSNFNNSMNGTTNNNFLNANMQCGTGGSLPDLTSFQFQNNQSQQNIQLEEYNKRNQHLPQYEPSSQLLQPNFQQHNHIGPVKGTHDNSVSPTRASSRYSPTNASHNSIANRRLSPGHLGLNRKALLVDPSSVESSPTRAYVSSPNSPLHPSMQSLPSLEFTVNSQQLNTISQTTVNGIPQNTKPKSKTNSKNGSGNNIYPNSSMNTNESLPPSPLSQHSCFNSPQGSPDPSISPKDLNFFNPSNSYDQMHKKFDSINLETNNQQQQQQQAYSPGMMTYNMISPTQGSPQPFPPTQQHHINGPRPQQLQHLPNQQSQQQNTLMSPTAANPHNNNGIFHCVNNSINNQPNLPNGNQLNTSNHEIFVNSNNNFDSSGEAGSNDNQSTINSRSGSLSSSSSVNNNLIEDELQNSHNNNNKNSQINYQTNRGSIKQHKNSIPDIIFTFSSDTTEDKNELKDLPIYNDIYMQKSDQFDYGLQMLTESVTMENQTNNNLENNINNHTLYQHS